MNADVLSIIKNQTQVQDDVHIERIYYECQGDVIKTIIELSGIKIPKHQEKPKTLFDDIREIVNEKESIYHNRNKGI